MTTVNSEVTVPCDALVDVVTVVPVVEVRVAAVAVLGAAVGTSEGGDRVGGEVVAGVGAPEGDVDVGAAGV